jgi:acyl dehydratase
MGFRVNYGLNNLRFPAALPVGDRVRMRLHLAAVDDAFDSLVVLRRSSVAAYSADCIPAVSPLSPAWSGS